MRRSVTFAIGKRDLVICKRCGCPDLAWATSQRTGKHYLVKTYVASDDGRHRTLVANKMAFHNCDEYRKELEVVQQEQRLRKMQELHPKAVDPGSILADSFRHVYPFLGEQDRESFAQVIGEAASRIGEASRQVMDFQQQPSRYGKETR